MAKKVSFFQEIQDAEDYVEEIIVKANISSFFNKEVNFLFNLLLWTFLKGLKCHPNF